MASRLIALAFFASVALTAGPALAQEQYPSKVIRIITPATGGGADVVARMLAPGLTAALGQQVIVDNRGSIATEVVAKSPPDGYTLLVNGSPLWLLPLMRAVRYDALRDLAPITQAVSSPSMLVVHPSLPVKSVRELIALARAKPGQLNYAAGTLGAAPHIAGELFNSMARVRIVRVAYKGSGPGLIGVMTGEVGLMFPGAASAWEYAKQGRVRALAICSLERSTLFPGLPTLAESGVPGFESISPQTVTAPARTPPAVIGRLHQEIVRILNVPENKARFESMGMQVVGSAPEELAAKMRAEITRVAKLVKEAGLREE